MDSPLARIQLPPKRASTTAVLKPPETLKLPDGRVFVTKDLLRQTTKSDNYNLRGRDPKRPLKEKNTLRYSMEDRHFMASATIKEVMDKYSASENYARVLISKSRIILSKLGEDNHGQNNNE